MFAHIRCGRDVLTTGGTGASGVIAWIGAIGGTFALRARGRFDIFSMIPWHHGVITIQKRL
jgi:hypothetical protein